MKKVNRFIKGYAAYITAITAVVTAFIVITAIQESNAKDIVSTTCTTVVNEILDNEDSAVRSSEYAERVTNQTINSIIFYREALSDCAFSYRTDVKDGNRKYINLHFTRR